MTNNIYKITLNKVNSKTREYTIAVNEYQADDTQTAIIEALGNTASTDNVLSISVERIK